MAARTGIFDPFKIFWEWAGALFRLEEGQCVERSQQAMTLVRAYYAYMAFLMFLRSSRAAGVWLSGTVGEPRLGLLFPGIFPSESWPVVALSAAVASFLASALSVAWPELRLSRIVSVVGFLVYQGMIADLSGKIDHGHHAAIWVGIAFCFLPQLKASSSKQAKAFLASFFGAQVMVGMLYSCAGICKIIGIVFDFPSGVTWLSLDAMSLTLAENWSASKQTLLGGFMIQNPRLSQGLNWSVLYLEAMSVLAVFRPALHRFWGLGLVLMHFAIVHTMKIHFHESAIILLLMLVASPFAPAGFSWRETVAQLPILREGVGCMARLIPAWTAKLSGGCFEKPAQENYVPHSLFQRSWIPVLVLSYVGIAFSRLEIEERRFQEDVYPVAAMWMYFRTDSSGSNVKRLERIRLQLDQRDSVFPRPRDISKSLKGKRSPKKGK